MELLPDGYPDLDGDGDERGVSLSPHKSTTKNAPFSPSLTAESMELPDGCTGLDRDGHERGVSLHRDEDKRGLSLHPLVEPLATDHNATESKLDHEDERSVSLHPLLDSPATDEKESNLKVDEGERRRAGKRQRLEDGGNLAEEGLAGTGKFMRKTEAVENQLITAREGQELKLDKEYLSRAQQVDDGDEDERSVSLHPLLDSRATDEKESDWKVDEGERRRAGKRQRVEDGGNLPEEEQVGKIRGSNKRLQGDSGDSKELVSHVTKQEFALRRNQGLAALLQHLGNVPVMTSSQDIQKRAANLAARRLQPVVNRTICHLPQGIIQDILMQLHGSDIRHAIASSFVFLRASVGPCNCNAFRDNTNFFGVIVQPRQGSPSFAFPNRVRFHPLGSVGLMMEKFIAMRFKSSQGCKIIDSRGGFLLVIKDPNATRFAVLMPIQTIHIRTLAAVPQEVQEQFVGAAVLPVQGSSFTVIRISRAALGIILREFRSLTGAWQQRNIHCPLALSSLPVSRNCPLYAENSIYLLDPQRVRP